MAIAKIVIAAALRKSATALASDIFRKKEAGNRDPLEAPRTRAVKARLACCFAAREAKLEKGNKSNPRWVSESIFLPCNSFFFKCYCCCALEEASIISRARRRVCRSGERVLGWSAAEARGCSSGR